MYPPSNFKSEEWGEEVFSRAQAFASDTSAWWCLARNSSCPTARRTTARRTRPSSPSRSRGPRERASSSSTRTGRRRGWRPMVCGLRWTISSSVAASWSWRRRSHCCRSSSGTGDLWCSMSGATGRSTSSVREGGRPPADSRPAPRRSTVADVDRALLDTSIGAQLNIIVPPNFFALYRLLTRLLVKNVY